MNSMSGWGIGQTAGALNIFLPVCTCLAGVAWSGIGAGPCHPPSLLSSAQQAPDPVQTGGIAVPETG